MGNVRPLRRVPGTADQDCIDGLYGRERTAMLQLATLMLGSVAEAEDVVHDAFSKVDLRFEQLEQPRAYLRTCVVNGCRSRLRHRRVVDRHERSSRSEGEPIEHLPSHLIELREALGVLGERQRTVIVLRYFADLPDPEIAKLLGVAPPTVRTIAHRALKLLRAELEPDGDRTGHPRRPPDDRSGHPRPGPGETGGGT